jgi:hypothetical protein
MKIDLFNNNHLALTKKEIRSIETFYTDALHNIKSNEDFINNLHPFCKMVIPVYDYCMDCFNKQSGLQGGKILELLIGDTLGRIFNAQYIDRNHYESNRYSIVLTGESGKGNGKTHDIEIFDKITGTTYVGEIKDEISRGGECDLKYDEAGKLFHSANAKNWDPIWQFFLDEFNSHSTIFGLFGHNYKISEQTEVCEKVAKNYFANVDFIFTIKDDKMVTIPINNVNLSTFFSFKGSEIRSTGKNPVNCFTPKYLSNQIINSEYFISEEKDYFIMNRGVLIEKKGRGGGITTRYGFIPGFIVRKDGVEFLQEDAVKISKKSIKQLNSNISIHLTLIAEYENLKTICSKEIELYE